MYLPRQQHQRGFGFGPSSDGILADEGLLTSTLDGTWTTSKTSTQYTYAPFPLEPLRWEGGRVTDVDGVGLCFWLCRPGLVDGHWNHWNNWNRGPVVLNV